MKARWKYYKDRHKRTARSFLYALALDEVNGWLSLKSIMMARMSEKERASLAYTALRSLNEEQRESVARHAVDVDLIGPPMPPWSDLREDATWWTQRASLAEKETYLLTIYEHLPKKDKKEFAQYLAG